MSKIERYIVTSAINNCELFAEGLETLETLAEHYQAELIVMPIRYNPYNIPISEVKWNEQLDSYMLDEDAVIKDTSLLTTMNISPTAVKPLSGLGGFEHSNNIIVAHPRLHMEHLPTATKGKIKQVLTTGTITKANYSASKVGKKASFHHSYGAVIIEVEGNTTYIRQVSIATDGTLCDLDIQVRGTEITKASVEAIVYGDAHEMFMADVVRTYGFFHEKSLLNTLKPNKVVLHDLLDTLTGSHHNEGRPFMQYRIASSGSTVIDEINSAIVFLGELVERGFNPVVVASNHNSHLTQWLERTSWKDHPTYAREILNMTLMMLDAIDAENNIDGRTPDVFKLLVDKVFGNYVQTLDYDH